MIRRLPLVKLLKGSTTASTLFIFAPSKQPAGTLIRCNPEKAPISQHPGGQADPNRSCYIVSCGQFQPFESGSDGGTSGKATYHIDASGLEKAVNAVISRARQELKDCENIAKYQQEWSSSPEADNKSSSGDSVAKDRTTSRESPRNHFAVAFSSDFHYLNKHLGDQVTEVPQRLLMSVADQRNIIKTDVENLFGITPLDCLNGTAAPLAELVATKLMLSGYTFDRRLKKDRGGSETRTAGAMTTPEPDAPAAIYNNGLYKVLYPAFNDEDGNLEVSDADLNKDQAAKGVRFHFLDSTVDTDALAGCDAASQRKTAPVQGRCAPALVTSDALHEAAIIANGVATARTYGNLRHGEATPLFILTHLIKGEILNSDADPFVSRPVSALAGGSQGKEVYKNERTGVELKQLYVGFDDIRSASSSIGAATTGGMSLLSAVAAGAALAHPPVVAVLEYRGQDLHGSKRPSCPIALIGKGVCYDAGGINLKLSAASLLQMHLDKMGAINALAVMQTAALLKLPVNLVVAVGLVENVISHSTRVPPSGGHINRHGPVSDYNGGGSSFYPGHIIPSFDRQYNIEITNTDAEGRLVLADLMSLLVHSYKGGSTAGGSTGIGPLITMATLTGNIITSLGDKRAGVFCNDGVLLRQLLTSAVATQQRLWPMPVGPEHFEAIKGYNNQSQDSAHTYYSADLVNCQITGAKEAGACTAAAFLHHFLQPPSSAEDREHAPSAPRWAHIDLAGPAMGSLNGGANGWGVELLVDYLRRQH